MNRFAVSPGWQVVMVDLGLRVDELLRRAQLPADLFTRPEGGLTTREFFRMWHAMEEMADAPAVALRILDLISVEAFDPPLFAALCSPNLEIAIRRISQFKPLIGPIRLRVTHEADLLVLAVEFLERDVPPPGMLLAAELGFFVKLARLATRTDLPARAVTLPLGLAPHPGYARFFGVPPRYGDAPSVSFALPDARRPFVTANNAMWQIFEPDLRRRLDALSAEAGIVERVRAALLELIPGGLATADGVAHALAISKRTLQRRLGDEGANFKTLLAEVREKLAWHYLDRSDLPCSQIAFLLGYQDPNSFFRAFNEWTGMTPEAARARPAR
ncbi:MAG: AraC family transcriptional regulator [Burkholderia sp.]|jgi:AraC-like DNA-binding protein|uniref:AraC family transcriptional regulator n=2 Tax=Burkholderia sp. TaxID=36773 RepID=UPI0025897E46|nr:AraC family transcriptional regulator [Burkholderia sp.]MCA3779410.1 AraC family transcriptional regulator [Burkholderia sp.]MCA3783707.1 AraC family transcriptional regulator [Burkholderia sp.]MCA3796607.1 AraC family transcriptional regulator [Burkholderia sp.]MCA3804140.1 AraC family transcriptional regulator [Burkholderia sp.]MCA3813574.1 AraC family transcriptional regulator [Burkholderia sp.]